LHRLAPKDTSADSSLIEMLLQPAAYPHPVNKVELIETHISWVLLTGDYVYKIKKPLDLGFLDFPSREVQHRSLAAVLRSSMPCGCTASIRPCGSTSNLNPAI